MNTTTNDKPSSWRSFALFGLGLAAMAGAGVNLVISEGGTGAFRWILVAFLLLMAMLAGGLVLDWSRLDRATKFMQTLALAACVTLLAALAIVLPGTLSTMWNS